LRHQRNAVIALLGQSIEFGFVHHRKTPVSGPLA
jgi:hypothetical protein